MVKYLESIDLGHLNKIIRDNGLDGKFFLQCEQEDLEAIGIGRVQWKNIITYMPSDTPAVGGNVWPTLSSPAFVPAGGGITLPWLALPA